MASSITTPCLKCGHVRSAADTAPAWQCPSCGVAYNKIAPNPSAPAGTAAPGRDRRQPTAAEGWGDTAGGTAIIVYFLLGTLVFVLIQARSDWLWFLSIPYAICAFGFWLAAYRRLRTVTDIPKSTIAAAAQGYVELHGRAEVAPGHELTGHLTRVPTVWYRYEWRVAGDKGDNGFGAQGVPFILRDASGECVVDPGKAEVICNSCESWWDGKTRMQEWSIRPGDELVVIGQFSSGSAAAESQLALRVASALAGESRDAPAYLARHDTNRDGKVDAHEVAYARAALRRDTLQQYDGQGGIHAVGPSPDGRPFIMICGSEKSVIRRYRLLTLLHLAVFVGAVAIAAHLFAR